MSYLNVIEELEDDVKTVKEWLIKQAHLPQNIDDNILRRFILSSNRSLEKTKHIIDLCYTIRSQAPEIFDNRDVSSPDIQHMLTLGISVHHNLNNIISDLSEVLPLPKTTNKNYKLIMFRISDKHTENFIFSDVLKLILMMADVRLASEMDIGDGEIPIFDMAGTTLQHLSKVTLPTLRKYMMYTQEAHPVRLKAIHVINTPSFLDKIMVLLKPFMKAEVAAMLHFHPNVESLSKYVPRALLPDEYGGSCGKIVDLKSEWHNKLLEYRDYLLDDRRWKINEQKRPKNSRNGKAFFGIQGSFRSLSID